MNLVNTRLQMHRENSESSAKELPQGLDTVSNKPVNVLFIVSSLTIGGAETHTVTLLNHLNLEHLNLSLGYLKPYEHLLPQLDQRRCKNGVFCCHVSRKIDWRAVTMLAKHIRDHEIDIVVCVNAYPMLYAWLARLIAGRKAAFVTIYHGSHPLSIKDGFQMPFYRLLFFRNDLLIYVCENQRRSWRTRGLRARRDVVIHNGVDVARYFDRSTTAENAEQRKRFGFLPTDYVVGLCAAMRPEKAHGDLLSAIGLLRANGTDVKCLLIGDGSERDRIENQIRAMGLLDHVRITGYLQDVRAAVAACDVIALVSRRIENFPIATIEAMAMGKPVVMSNVGGANEQNVDGETGFLYPAGDITALSNSLKKLESPDIRRRLGQRARERVVSDFSLDTMLRKYEVTLRSIVKRT